MKTVYGQKLRGSSRIPFFGIVLIALIALMRIVSDQIVNLSLPTRLQDFFILSSSIIIEALPFVILGILLSVIVQIWLPSDLLFKILPKHTAPRRIALSFLGIFLPVCECGNVPLARGLMIKGLTVSESLTFLLAAPILNPITIITTQQAFGSDSTILIARLLGGFMIANIVGWVFSGYKKSSELLTPEFEASCKVDHNETGHQHGKLKRSIEVFIREANVIVPALFVGGIIAGLVQVIIPRSILVELGSDPVLSIFAMMGLAFIVSICANVDAFFALAFYNTFTTGSIVTFLVFGPIVDIKMLSLMRTTYKKRVLVTITFVTVLVSASLGLAVNYAF
jgi:hypothetical protein